MAKYSKKVMGKFVINKYVKVLAWVAAIIIVSLNIKLIGAGEDRISDYNKQIEYLKKNGSDFPKDMSIVKTPRSTSATEVREKIKNEDFTAFKKLVPPSISSLYNSLVTGMNSHIKANESLEN